MAENQNKRKSRKNPAISHFIIDNVEEHPRDIVPLTAKKFGITNVSARRYIKDLVNEGVLDAAGTTRTKQYKLKELFFKVLIFEINEKFEEHIAWRTIAHELGELPKNILEMWQHGVSEMLNNVKDHSGSKTCLVSLYRNAKRVKVVIADEGIGVFKKISDACHLNDLRESILELSKGKLTTDPERHSGEGIFFTSRMFTEFMLGANNLWFSHHLSEDDDWLMESGSGNIMEGTSVFLTMNIDEKHTITDIFKKYEQDEDGYLSFSKTHVPVRLALYDDEQLVSRSQARRVLTRFNRFSEVILDFSDVPMIGQAFADEIFRVYRNEHPEVRIIPVRESEAVRAMIRRVTA